MPPEKNIQFNMHDYIQHSAGHYMSYMPLKQCPVKQNGQNLKSKNVEWLRCWTPVNMTYDALPFRSYWCEIKSLSTIYGMIP